MVIDAASSPTIVQRCVSVSSGDCRFADRKSTRLNSSHLVISYAVFCLKKKKHRIVPPTTPLHPSPPPPRPTARLTLSRCDLGLVTFTMKSLPPDALCLSSRPRRAPPSL